MKIAAHTRRVIVVMRHPVGGIRTYILYNYPTLLNAGYRFTFVAPPSSGFSDFQDELRHWPEVQFVEIGLHGQPHQPYAPLRPASIRRLIKETKPRALHSHGFGAAAATVVANFGIHVPHVFTSHDVIRPEAQFHGMLGKLKLYAFRQLLPMPDKIIAVTQDARANHLQHIPALNRCSRKFHTILHGVDVTRFNPTARMETPLDLRQRLGVPGDMALLGFMGRFMQQKGFLPLVEALNQMIVETPPKREFRLLAVGSGDFVKEYRARVEELPELKKRVFFMDHVPNAMPVFREIDLLVMPSLWEACGLLAMEAMCAGVPVLGTDCVGLREVLANTPSHVVPVGDVHSLSRALCSAIDSPWKDEAAAFATAAQARFDVRRAAEELCKVFDDVVN